MNKIDRKIIFNGIKKNVKKANWLLIGLTVACVAITTGNMKPAQAQAAAGSDPDYVAKLKDRAKGIDDVSTIVVGVAASATAYAAGSKVLKRMIYS
jgi:hypothetical protein